MNMAKPTKQARIAELEDELKQRDRRIHELKADLTKVDVLVTEMCEHVEDANALIDSWIEAFGMQQNDEGKWSWGPFVDAHHDLYERYRDLLREWNQLVP